MGLLSIPLRQRFNMNCTRLYEPTGLVCLEHARSVNEAHPAGDALILIRIVGSTGSARQYWTHGDELVETHSSSLTLAGAARRSVARYGLGSRWYLYVQDSTCGPASTTLLPLEESSKHRYCETQGQRGRILEVREREGAVWLLLKSDYMTRRNVQHG